MPTLDRDDAVYLNARTMRALAHPVRVRLLGLLRTEGPSTATRLGERTGLSSAATSYHLRQLAEHGLVVDDADAQRNHGRERWWRAAHRFTVMDSVDDDPESVAAATEYLRAVATRYADHVTNWLDEMLTAPKPWRDASTLSNVQLLLTTAETVELMHRIEELLLTARTYEPGEGGPRGSRRVSVQWQVLPHLAGKR